MLVTCRVKYLNRILCLSESRLYRFVFIWLGMEGGILSFFVLRFLDSRGGRAMRKEREKTRALVLIFFSCPIQRRLGRQPTTHTTTNHRIRTNIWIRLNPNSRRTIFCLYKSLSIFRIKLID
jgi:hypothetical protein